MGTQLKRRCSSKNLRLFLTDGRPNNPVDGYEGRYGLEDTRRALWALRARGLHSFGLTVDGRGREYLSHLFGLSRYAVISQLHLLSQVRPTLYARVTLEP